MNSSTPLHPDDETLLRLVDEDLSPQEIEELNRHIGGCQECVRRVKRLRDTLGGYLKFHETVLKKSMPAPPGEWSDRSWNPPIETAKPADSGRVVQFPLTASRPQFRMKRWLAAAAAVVMAVLLVRRLGDTPGVSAAELLQKAEAAELTVKVAAKSRRRIRIQTADRTWVRAQGQPAEDVGGVRRLFDEAGYSWDDPLSAASYSRWRAHLGDKRDDVAKVPATGPVESYVVTTSTSSSVLTEASLTLRAEGLHAVACMLQFGAARVNITELPDEPQEALPTELPAIAQTGAEQQPAATAAQTMSAEETIAGPETELHVVAALHNIGADLGEPIEITRDGGAIVVSVTGMDAARSGQVQSAVSQIPGVRFELKGIPQGASEGLPQRRRRPQIYDRDPLVPENLRDQLIESTEVAIERIYALRAMAKRFPPEVVQRFAPADAEILQRILVNHVETLANTIPAIASTLLPGVPNRSEGAVDVTGAGWQRVAERMLASIQKLDHALNAGAAGGGDIATRKVQVAEALTELNGEVSEFSAMVRR